MAYVGVNGGQLWIEEAGDGPAVLFVHGGLGDSRLWQPQAAALSDRFRCIRHDLRFYGRSTGPGEPWSTVDDLVGVLDALEVDRAALVGLSLGGGIELDAVLAYPDRFWGIVHVAGGVSDLPIDVYSDEQEAAFEDAVESGDLETAMEIDFAVWAPLGADETFCELWLQTPDARGLPEGAAPLPREEARERLNEIALPTLVVVAEHDPEALREVGATVARRIAGARLVEIGSDHYLTLREPDVVTQLLGDFLTSHAPASTRASSSG